MAPSEGRSIEAEVDRWRKSLKRSEERTPPRQEHVRNLSDMEIKALYTPADLAERDLSFPGEFPFTRGVHPTMYRGRLWTMRQYAGFGTAEETNKRFHYLLQQGQTGLSVAFDLPTQMGYDSDHPMARGEVGKVGVAIDALEDMSTLMAGLPLDRVSVSMTINATAPILLTMLVAQAEADGVPRKLLRGTVQNDLLKEYAARGTYIYPPKASMRLVTDIMEFCSQEMPRWNSISVSGYHMREAGCTAVQEVAFTLSNAIAYLEAAVDRGLDVDRIAPRVSFFFAAHNDLLEEVAKFRAARRMWARIVRERFDARDEDSLKLRFHTQTAGVTLTAQQPEVNLVRVALQSLAAVLGGTQSLHTNSMDEALALPTERAARIALRTQQLLAHESGVANTIDPLAGSYFVESMTAQVEEEATKYIEEIDRMGGALAAIEKGYVQRKIADAAYRYQREVEARERLVVGVNAFREDEPGRVETLRVPPEVAREQRERVSRVRSSRDAARWRASLAALAEAAASEDNLVPIVLDAVKARATLGEISDALREVFGVHQAPTEF
jgi:methylmalonyl-CoA mutase N-terminal domain/subunit